MNQCETCVDNGAEQGVRTCLVEWAEEEGKGWLHLQDSQLRLQLCTQPYLESSKNIKNGRTATTVVILRGRKNCVIIQWIRSVLGRGIHALTERTFGSIYT